MGIFGFGSKKKSTSKKSSAWKCGNCGKPTRYPRVFCAKCGKIHETKGIKRLTFGKKPVRQEINMSWDKEVYRRHGVESEKDDRYSVEFKRKKSPPKVEHLYTIKKKGKKRTIKYAKKSKSFWERLMEQVK